MFLNIKLNHITFLLYQIFVKEKFISPNPINESNSYYLIDFSSF